MMGCAAVGYLASNKTNDKACKEHQDQQANGEADANPLLRAIIQEQRIYEWGARNTKRVRTKIMVLDGVHG